MQRGFSALEAWGYELLVADGVTDAVWPTIEAAVAGSRVLDVGCGGGALARRLRAAGHDVVAVDLARTQASRAGGVQASALALPFCDGAFDSVVSSCSIKHWPDPAAGVAECRRVVRSGGALVVVEMDRDSTRDEVRRFVGMTRVPRPIRGVWVRFEERAVLTTAPTVGELGAMVGSPAVKVGGLPYAAVVHHP